MPQQVLSLEAAYRAHRGLLFSALGRLARQGYVTPPAESVDLIHDFFIETWDGLAGRYDPSRASLATYMYAAFVRFARPRIVRIQRQRANLVDPRELMETLSAAGDDDRFEPGIALDLKRLQQIIAGLPPESRQLLDIWLRSGRASERELSRSLGVSRYGVRQRLIEVLGRVATALGTLDGWKESDRRVAQAMWGEQLTFSETACGVMSQ